jgi:excinuclease UvrABC ATPase subunit
VLYASIGLQHCPNCGRKVGKQSAQQIVDEILKMPAGSKVQILAPIVTNRKGEHKDLLTEAQKRGFSRARIDGRCATWRSASSWTRSPSMTSRSSSTGWCSSRTSAAG